MGRERGGGWGGHPAVKREGVWEVGEERSGSGIVKVVGTSRDNSKKSHNIAYYFEIEKAQRGGNHKGREPGVQGMGSQDPLSPYPLHQRKLSTVIKKNLGRFKFDESGQESLRAHESFKPNESESLTSRPVAVIFRRCQMQ